MILRRLGLPRNKLRELFQRRLALSIRFPAAVVVVVVLAQFSLRNIPYVTDPQRLTSRVGIRKSRP